MEAHDKGLVCAEALIAGHVQRLQTTQPANLGSRWATSGLVSDQWGGASASPHFFSDAAGQRVGGSFAENREGHIRMNTSAICLGKGYPAVSLGPLHPPTLLVHLEQAKNVIRGRLNEHHLVAVAFL